MPGTYSGCPTILQLLCHSAVKANRDTEKRRGYNRCFSLRITSFSGRSCGYPWRCTSGPCDQLPGEDGPYHQSEASIEADSKLDQPSRVVCWMGIRVELDSQMIHDQASSPRPGTSWHNPLPFSRAGKARGHKQFTSPQHATNLLQADGQILLLGLLILHVQHHSRRNHGRSSGYVQALRERTWGAEFVDH
jgi:hypothetical protein